jgi:hypothetical protein
VFDAAENVKGPELRAADPKETKLHLLKQCLYFKSQFIMTSPSCVLACCSSCNYRKL